MWGRERALKRRGLLSGRERFSLFIGAPLLLLILGLEVVRIARAMMGGPLLITGFTEPDTIAEWSSNPALFMAGLILHAAIMAFLTGALFFQVQAGRRWLRSKGR
jgi:hypothetical protein